MQAKKNIVGMIENRRECTVEMKEISDTDERSELTKDAG